MSAPVHLGTSEALAAAIAAHILQSTVFALVAGILTLAFRSTGARIRFRIWFAASLKFLIPFSPLIALGAQFGAQFGLGRAPVRPFLYFWLPELAASATGSVAAAVPVGSRIAQGAPVAYVLCMVWFFGLVIVLSLWRRQWRAAFDLARTSRPVTSGRVHTLFEKLRRSAAPGGNIALLSSRSAAEPCVLGILRPMIILPEAILCELNDSGLEAILAHELSHIRRRDNLLAAIHMVMQAVFWFHPLAWWLRGQLLEERERACDEEVLRMGAEPLVYARGILTVCRLSLSSSYKQVAIVASGIASADLRRRLEVIMSGKAVSGLSRTRQAALAVSAIASVVVPMLAGMLLVPGTRAQQLPAITQALPAFEVASIKSSNPDSHLNIEFAAGGRLVVTHATLRFLIKIAWDLTDDQILGGPAWLGSSRFDVEGKPSTPLGGDPASMTGGERGIFHEQVRLRLQRLVIERFHLESRAESKPMPVFALVVSHNGPKLKRSAAAGDPQLNFGHGILQAKQVDMTTLARFLAEGQVGRPVTDATALTGKFDFRLEWSPDSGLNPVAPDFANQQATDTGGTSIFTALQQQLGLRLDPRTSPANCMIVTRAELPSRN